MTCLPSEPIDVQHGTLDSAGRPVRYELIGPNADGPPLVLLHGSDGFRARAALYRETATGLADAGYRCLMVQYFDRTGTPRAPRLDPVLFLEWMQAAADAIGFAGTLPGAEGRPVGLVGFSLGAYLSLAVAAHEPRVGAVVACCGGLPHLLAPAAGRLPPALVLHGEDDPVVPVTEAYALQRVLRAAGRPHELHVYPGQGHTFDAPTREDALRRAVAFLGEHLG